MLDYEDSTSVLVVRLGSRCDTPLGDLKRWLPCPTRAPIILCISDSLPCHFAGDRRLPEQAPVAKHTATWRRPRSSQGRISTA